jgi:ubiquitin-like modifier-activating enzyme ATG7
LLLLCCSFKPLQATAQLQQLVSEHDVVFLLTDTRESRWLPTMLAAAAGKVAITAALGFDTFLVMRHGVPLQLPAAAAAGDAAGNAAAGGGSSCGQEQQQQQQLGCYFCNDVVAPLNSTIDRTLDQQCTVARPGLAPIAGALAVELMAALLQHPLRGAAPAPGGDASSSSSSGSGAAGALGPVPHMVRGQLSGFSQTCMVGQAFSQCTACSQAVLQAYAADGWGFLLKVNVIGWGGEGVHWREPGWCVLTADNLVFAARRSCSSRASWRSSRGLQSCTGRQQPWT